MLQDNNLPPYAEVREQEVQTDLTSPDILKTKQLIPYNFVELFRPERNYLCSTHGLPKTLSERYVFFRESDWYTLDIPLEIGKKLGLTLGENCSYPFYISSKVLTRKLECGGITIKNEKEIFLLKPFTEEDDKIKELEEERKNKEQKLTDLETQISNLNNANILSAQQRDTLQGQLTQANSQISQLSADKKQLERDLTTERQNKEKVQRERDNRPNITIQTWNDTQNALREWTNNFSSQTPRETRTRIPAGKYHR